MGHLTETLHDLRMTEKDNGTPDWVIIGAVVVLLIVIAGFRYYKKDRYLKQLCSAKRGGKLLTPTAAPVYHGKFLTPTALPVYHAVSVKSGDGTHI